MVPTPERGGRLKSDPVDQAFGDFLPGHPGCPYSRVPLPGIGGEQGPNPEDFVVDELPAYPPSGAGDHWFIHVRKRSLSTPQLTRILAQTSGCAERDIGIAGRKDSHAVTTQWISLPCEPVPPDDDRIEFIDVQRHNHKLRLGHSKGNRFTIRWIGVDPAATERLPELVQMSTQGLPNYFGPQRFGRDGRGVDQSRRQLGFPRAKKNQLRFPVSVLQAALFNQWLGRRVEDGLLHTALEGDILKKRETGGLFESEEPGVDSERVQQGHVDPTGPIYGPKMWAPPGEAGVREQVIRDRSVLTAEEWERMARLGKGSRRLARVVPTELEWSLDQDELTIRFSLPPGSYATVILAAFSGVVEPTSGGST